MVSQSSSFGLVSLQRHAEFQRTALAHHLWVCMPSGLGGQGCHQDWQADDWRNQPSRICAWHHQVRPMHTQHRARGCFCRQLCVATTCSHRRGDFGIDVGRNIIHGSDSVEVRQWLQGSMLGCLHFTNAAAPLPPCPSPPPAVCAVKSAQREIALWFKPEDLAQYELNAKPWIYE